MSTYKVNTITWSRGRRTVDVREFTSIQSARRYGARMIDEGADAAEVYLGQSMVGRIEEVVPDYDGDIRVNLAPARFIWISGRRVYTLYASGKLGKKV